IGAPKVSSAICTMSMARTTPAQKPRGFRSRTRFAGVPVTLWLISSGARVEAFTPLSIRVSANGRTRFEPFPVQFGQAQWAVRQVREIRLQGDPAEKAGVV